MEAIEPTQLAACDDQETVGSLSQALLPVIFIGGAGKVLLSSSSSEMTYFTCKPVLYITYLGKINCVEPFYP